MTEPTPRTDREVYTTTARDIGFQAVNSALCRTIERELAAMQQRLDHRITESLSDADDVDDLLAELEATQQELGKWIARCMRLQAELDARDKGHAL